MALFSKDAPLQTADSKPEVRGGTAVSVLGPGIVFEGTITGKENLIVEGRIKGKIQLDSDVRIASGARIEATVDAINVTVEGAVVGDIAARKKIELISSANVDGNMRAPKIVVAEGAKFRGAVDMGSEKPKE
jgi:cytoskeletal protein CcmA (bactofilin family)